MRKTAHVSFAPSSSRATAVSGRRRGTLFHYTLVYMTISSIVLTVAGVILHSVLKADASDRRESLFLSSLSRAEQHLRKDSDLNGFRYLSETALAAVGPEDSKIAWTIDLGTLKRTVLRNEAVVANERFVFPAGSQIRFQQDSSTAVVVMVTEPSAMVKYQAGADGGTLRSKPLSEAQPATPAAVARPASVEIWLNGEQP